MPQDNIFRQAAEEVRETLRSYQRDAQKSRVKSFRSVDRRKAVTGDPVTDLMKQLGIQVQDLQREI